jgi:hypothetical protein
METLIWNIAVYPTVVSAKMISGDPREILGRKALEVMGSSFLETSST